jgi:hypothetical protein
LRTLTVIVDARDVLPEDVPSFREPVTRLWNAPHINLVKGGDRGEAYGTDPF